MKIFIYWTVQEMLGSLLRCQVKVDVAASSRKEKQQMADESKKEKQIADESSVSEAIFKQTKKDRKIREKKVPVAVAQVYYACFYILYTWTRLGH